MPVQGQGTRQAEAGISQGRFLIVAPAGAPAGLPVAVRNTRSRTNDGHSKMGIWAGIRLTPDATSTIRPGQSHFVNGVADLRLVRPRPRLTEACAHAAR